MCLYVGLNSSFYKSLTVLFTIIPGKILKLLCVCVCVAHPIILYGSNNSTMKAQNKTTITVMALNSRGKLQNTPRNQHKSKKLNTEQE